MRKLIVTASWVAAMTLAAAVRADEPASGGGTRKLAKQQAKPAAAAEVPATEVKKSMARTAESGGPAGLKTSTSANKLTRAASLAPQSRLSNMRRAAPTRSTKNLTATVTHTASAANVPVTKVTRTMTATPRTAAATKQLATQKGPALHAVGVKLSTSGDVKSETR